MDWLCNRGKLETPGKNDYLDFYALPANISVDFGYRKAILLKDKKSATPPQTFQHLNHGGTRRKLVGGP